MQITDLNLDCLEKICRYLCIGDLLNVADSNVELKRAAGYVFTLKYGKKGVHFRDFIIYQGHDDIEEKDDIEVFNWKRSFQILRCCGSSISQLGIGLLCCSVVKVGTHGHQFKRLFNYINEYCAESLLDLKVIGIREGALDDLTKPFLRLRKLQILGHYVKRELGSLFPKLQELTFSYGDAYDMSFESIDCHFPCLERIRFNEMFYMGRDVLSKNHSFVYSFLRLNPQLKHLELPSIDEDDFFQTINECVPHLEYLSIKVNFGKLKFAPSDHFKHLKKLEFCSGPGLLPVIPLLIDQLEDFRLYYYNECTEEFYDFLRRNPSIKMIVISATPFARTMNVMKLASILPHLREVDVSCYEYTLSEVHSFLDQFQCLERIRFKLQSESDYSDYLSRSKNGWKCSEVHKKFQGRDLKYFELFRDR